jgi:hypothetical protein
LRRDAGGRRKLSGHRDLYAYFNGTAEWDGWSQFHKPVVFGFERDPDRIAGFAAPLSMICQIGGASASACGLSNASFTPTSVTTITVTMTTTSQYTVVGYGAFGACGWLWLIGLGSGLLLWRRRRSAGAMLRSCLALALLAALGLGMSGCSGKLPTQNAAYTGPGTYTITVTATDGFLIHSATYKLTVTGN